VILALLNEAQHSGARLESACKELGISRRTVERWRDQDGGDDLRKGPKSAPPNKLSQQERQHILDTLNSPRYRDLSPNQIVPLLADQGVFLGSESSFYRILREEDLQNHREPSRPAVYARPSEKIATGPNQVWSWDITYLPSPVLGRFFYLYLVMDVWSRKIVGWEIHTVEDMALSSAMIRRLCAEEKIPLDQLKLHADNGGPMKGATMLATLQKLGVAASFSRPRVSDDNPFSEALFRTLKYRPEYPRHPFGSFEVATTWVAGFVHWYNQEHLHSEIAFVTPSDRHAGLDVAILEKRQKVYERARLQNPNRWSGKTRNWTPPKDVVLNGNYQHSMKAAA
jgi:transposase InsO family protein